VWALVRRMAGTKLAGNLPDVQISASSTELQSGKGKLKLEARGVYRTQNDWKTRAPTKCHSNA